jgi:nicotinamide-nucleotide amidase
VPVWLIAVGDELLEGRTADTNSRSVQRALGIHAVSVRGIQVVHDTVEDIVAALNRTGAGLVVVYGGLGSTPDDITREGVAAWAGVPLETDPDLLQRLQDRWRARGVHDLSAARRQAEVPAGLTPLTNHVGSAPALVGRLADRTLVVLPGVPAELVGLLPDVVAWLEGSDLLPSARPTLLFRTAQRAELALVETCAPVREALPGLQWAWWLVPWGVDLRVALPAAGVDPQQLARAESELVDRLAPITYARRPIELNEVIQEAMLARGATLAVAESCTAGLLAARLTDPPGASGYFRGGILAYADAVKQQQLGVPAALLASDGAVSESVVVAMADRCRRQFGTDYGLAVTGIAGPGGGSDLKPVGTTWVALATPTASYARCYWFPSTRVHNRRLTVAVALDTLRRTLAWGDDRPPWLPDDSWARET